MTLHLNEDDMREIMRLKFEFKNGEDEGI